MADALHELVADADMRRRMGAGARQRDEAQFRAEPMLCPAGAGPNTLRLWESLAVGSVPVLLGPTPRLPEGGTLPPIDWEAIVLRVADDQIPELPRIPSHVPIEEIRRRQQLGLRAYHWVRAQRYF